VVKKQFVYHGGMPIFEYICKQCDHRFEALVFGSEKAACPKCESKSLTPQLSVFAVAASSGKSMSPSAGPCGSCGDPRGAGACSMPDLD
jgi:putative FmdB family regulatory protein